VREGEEGLGNAQTALTIRVVRSRRSRYAAVNAGAALVYSARVMDAFKEYPRAASSN
jgi:anthranilate/para-aminobenzoate synthase component I